MLPEKFKIEIEKGKIKSVEPSEIGVELILDGKKVIYEKAFALPGLVDSHLHFFGIGEVALMPDFRNCRNEEEMLDLINQKPFHRGDWLVGFGWNQENFPGKRYPKIEVFDKAFPDSPLFLKRIDGHSALVNSAALRLLGLDEYSISPAGGIIQKNHDGTLNGILVDSAMDIAINALPFYGKEQIWQVLDYSQKYLARLGITEVIDMDLEPRLIEHLKEFDKSGKLFIRVNSFVKAHNDEYEDYIQSPYSGKNFSVKGIKLYADGALGSRGAALKKPYSDMPDEYGLLLLDEKAMFEKVEKAIKKGFSVAIHSIGDRGAELVLNVYNKILCSNLVKTIQKRYEHTGEIPFRLEHCQVVAREDLPKFANGLIAASVQPIHYVSDTESGMAQKRLGENRMKDAYRWKSLAEAGGLLISGSDAPIESPNPFQGIHALVNSNRIEERISLSEAIDTYSVNPHKSLGMQSSRGQIKKGYDADIIVIKESSSIAETELICTIANGKMIYQKD
jgi:hypothetical protein